MKIIFRVDSSIEIGSGHVMRCMTLAEALSSDATIIFVYRFMLKELELQLRTLNYELKQLAHNSNGEKINNLMHSHWLGTSQEKDALETIKIISDVGNADWLVIDHYGLDYRFETQLKKYVKNILVIDDLADRQHDCDIIIDQNPYPNINSRYDLKIPEQCIRLLGPDYCIIRKEFLYQSCKNTNRKGPIRSILVYYGGVDQQNHTQEAIEELLAYASNKIINGQLKVNVVVGASHPAINKINQLCKNYNIAFYIQSKEMAKLMSESDFAFGAGGISTYERLFLKLPSLIIATAENQIEPLNYMAKLGYIKLYKDRVELKKQIKYILENDNMPQKQIVKIGIKEILKNMQIQYTQLISPSALDIRRTYYWLQNDRLIKDFLMSSKPNRCTHFSYWRNNLNSESVRVFSIYNGEYHVGNCGLKNIDFTNKKCELWIYLGDYSSHGKGIASKAMKELKNYAKNSLSLNNIYLHVSSINKPAISLYLSNNFKFTNNTLLTQWKNKNITINKMECTL